MSLLSSNVKIQFTSYKALKSWLYNEIGEVSLTTIQKHNPPAILGNITELSESEANQKLKEVFIGHFLSEVDYQNQVDFLSQPIPRETRLKIKSPLPSTDFSVLLATLPEVDYLHRAAALSHVAAKLHLQFLSGDLTTRISRDKNKNCSIYNNIFGVSIIPNEPENQICSSKDSKYINVLFRGNAYLLDIIEGDNVISHEIIYSSLKNIVNQNPAIESTGLLRSVPLPISYEAGKSLNQEALSQLQRALFHLCIDEVSENPSNLNELFSSIFSENQYNRWYGSFEIVVRTDGEAALIFSYMCGLEGIQANEVAEELYQRSTKLIKNKSFSSASATNVYPIKLGISDTLKEQLKLQAAPLFHSSPSVLSIPLGLDFFKKIQLSPNIGITFLLMLAFREVGNLDYLPETSQAVLVGEQSWGGVQLDWLRVRPEKLRQFLEYPQDIELFRQAITEHQHLIKKCRESLSPFLFFDNPLESKDEELINFYLALGKEEVVAAYRHYLCSITRNPQALDIISSSLRLSEGIQSVGRPGTRSKLVNFSGTHVLFSNTRTDIVFTPAIGWEDRLSLVMERIHHWMRHLESINQA